MKGLGRAYLQTVHRTLLEEHLRIQGRTKWYESLKEMQAVLDASLVLYNTKRHQRMISHSHRCIFVHIPKTAGQSIEHVFLDSLGLTWRNRAPLLLRPNQSPDLGPPRLAHLKARDYIRYNYISEELFQDYFSFAFVRNPWDRMVSFYKYLSPPSISFEKFLFHDFVGTLWSERQWFVGPQYEFVVNEQGEMILDFVGYFHRLDEDFGEVCRMLGLARTRLKHVNRSRSSKTITRLSRWLPFLKKQRREYIDYYNSRTREIVGSLYEGDIETFGFRFGE